MRDYKFRPRRSASLVFSPRRTVPEWRWRLLLAVAVIGSVYVTVQLWWRAPAAPVVPAQEIIELPLPAAPASPRPSPGHVETSAAPRATLPPFSGPFVFVYEVEPGDTLHGIFQTLGIAGDGLPWHKLAPEQARRLERLRPGERLTIALDASGQFATLRLALDATRTLNVRREANRLVARVETLPTERRQQCLSAVIGPSLRGATRAAGIPEAIVTQAATVLRPQMDMTRALRPGDRLTVLFERAWVQDQPVSAGELLAVAVIAGKKRYHAVRYTHSDGKTAYYTPDGEPLDKKRLTFLRAPLVYTRVSSGFSRSRKHPILGYVRPHEGVDFAAPVGRAVVASADGVVVFQGRKNGYGNVLIIRHGRRYQTVYGHLSRFARGVDLHAAVSRGQTIGYVGDTGLATGPHLHYELHVDNRPVDPLSAELPFSDPFDDEEKARFKRTIKPLLAELRRQDEGLLAANR